MLNMARFYHMINGLKLIVLMVAVQAAIAGVNVIYKLASNSGMTMRVLAAYRSLFASAVTVPLALYFERNSRPKLTWMVIFQAFVGALFGATLTQNLYGQGLVMTSATFASATINLVPALTFIMAVIFRMERLELKTKAGKAKVVGTIVCTGGAMILTLYKGAELKLWSIHTGLLHKDSSSEGGHDLPTSHPKGIDHIMGPIYTISSAFSAAFGLICRAKLSESYPCHYSSSALMCLMGLLQTVVFALCMENRHWHRWKLGWNIRLLSVAYSGIVASGLVVVATMWCVRMKGPLFVSVFYPLILVLVAIMGSLLLEERLHLGSVLGAVVIVCGLYTVLWGKAIEKRIPSIKPISEKSAYDQQVELSNIAGNDKDAKSCDMMAIEVAPNLPPTPGIDASADNRNGEKDDHQYQLQEGLPIPKG